MDRSREGPNLTTSDLGGLRVPRGDVTDSNVYEGAKVEIDRKVRRSGISQFCGG